MSEITSETSRSFLLNHARSEFGEPTSVMLLTSRQRLRFRTERAGITVVVGRWHSLVKLCDASAPIHSRTRAQDDLVTKAYFHAPCFFKTRPSFIICCKSTISVSPGFRSCAVGFRKATRPLNYCWLYGPAERASVILNSMISMQCVGVNVAPRSTKQSHEVLILVSHGVLSR